MADDKILLDVKNLKKYYPVKKGLFQRTVNHVKAVDDISFSVRTGETLGLVGESGCGKSTTGRTILQLIKETSGKINFEGIELTDLKSTELRSYRKKMQMIFQDPYASLDPRMSIADIVGEPLIIHKMAKNLKDRNEQVVEIMRNVGLESDFLNRYPFEFSGGQRQRIGIARALVLNPSFIIADEPVSALDVSIQAQVINLLQELRSKFNLTYLFIAHDLSVVKHISDRVAVMYLGRIVELGEKRDLFANPLHPYTKALLSAIPIPDPKKKSNRIILSGDVPSPLNPPSGCHFYPRCPEAQKICCEVEPELIDHGNGHLSACHFINN